MELRKNKQNVGFHAVDGVEINNCPAWTYQDIV